MAVMADVLGFKELEDGLVSPQLLAHYPKGKATRWPTCPPAEALLHSLLLQTRLLAEAQCVNLLSRLGKSGHAPPSVLQSLSRAIMEQQPLEHADEAATIEMLSKVGGHRREGAEWLIGLALRLDIGLCYYEEQGHRKRTTINEWNQPCCHVLKAGSEYFALSPRSRRTASPAPRGCFKATYEEQQKRRGLRRIEVCSTQLQEVGHTPSPPPLQPAASRGLARTKISESQFRKPQTGQTSSGRQSAQTAEGDSIVTRFTQASPLNLFQSSHKSINPQKYFWGSPSRNRLVMPKLRQPRAQEGIHFWGSFSRERGQSCRYVSNER